MMDQSEYEYLSRRLQDAPNGVVYGKAIEWQGTRVYAGGFFTEKKPTGPRWKWLRSWDGPRRNGGNSGGGTNRKFSQPASSDRTRIVWQV